MKTGFCDRVPGLLLSCTRAFVILTRVYSVDESDPLRKDPAYGPYETRQAKPFRDDAGVRRDALAAQSWSGAKARNPAWESGINYLTHLAHVPLFDLVRDFTPDMMHLNKQILEGHIIPLLKGVRGIAYRSYVIAWRNLPMIWILDLFASKGRLLLPTVLSGFLRVKPG